MHWFPTLMLAVIALLAVVQVHQNVTVPQLTQVQHILEEIDP